MLIFKQTLNFTPLAIVILSKSRVFLRLVVEIVVKSLYEIYKLSGSHTKILWVKIHEVSPVIWGISSCTRRRRLV